MSAANLLGIPKDFQWERLNLKVAARDLFTEIAFADWCAAEAALALSRLRPKIPADFYSEQMRIFNSKLAGKQFTWGSEDVHHASWSDAGQRHLLWLKLKRGESLGGDTIEREQIDAIAANADKWAELLQIMMEQDYPFVLTRAKQMIQTENPGQQVTQPVTPPPDSPSTSRM